MPKFREPYNYDIEEASRSAEKVMDRYHHYDPTDPAEDLAVQSAEQDADINVMIKRFGLGAVAKPQAPGFYDMTELTDYATSLNALDEAKRRFMTVPSDLRQRFNNNPGEFIKYLRDPKNTDEAEKLGILKPRPRKPDAIDVRVITDPPPV